MTEISIHTLPFHIFRKVILTGNLKLLGEGEEMDLAIVWEDILEGYADALGETDTDGYLIARRELLYYQSQKYLVAVLIELLRVTYVLKWAKMLNKILRANFQFDPHNIEEYFKYLDRCVNRSRGFELQVTLALEKVRAIEEKKQGNALVPTDEFFERVLLNLHEFSNWQFDNNEITTFQYCELVKRYQQHIEYLKTKKNGRS
jgi:hypothetical protein